MPRRLIFFIVGILLLAPILKAGPPVDIYSSGYWVVAETEKTVTWVQIHNSKEDIQLTGIAHVSVFSGKKSSPASGHSNPKPSSVRWVCVHLAVTADALARSAIRPAKAISLYPEMYTAEYLQWQEDQKKGTAVICTTTISDYLKTHGIPEPH